MAKRKHRKHYNPSYLLEAVSRLPNPLFDKKRNLHIRIEGRARSNQTRAEHIVEFGHNLKVRDIELIPDGINKCLFYKKDPRHKRTYNYYLKRKGEDRGMVKVSIMISQIDPTKAWVKTIFVAYKVK